MSNLKESVIPAHIEEQRLITKGVWVKRNNQIDRVPTIACILDEFSMQSYAPEANFVPLTMENWFNELEESEPDLLFVESAWRGSNGSWWNSVQRAGKELQGIVAWCNARGIPTVFWNKEDPVHFSTFLGTAKMFDIIFTTDTDSIPNYKSNLGKEEVYFLPFAAQPRVHNPVEKFERIAGCSFAGAYYSKYVERNRDFSELFDAMSSIGEFDIYDRNFNDATEEQIFPEKYQSSIVGTLNPNDIDVAYKGYEFGLNLNSVKQSQSMFARRVFELLASNTAVVSNYSRGLYLFFGELVFATDNSVALKQQIEKIKSVPNGLNRFRQMGLRKVMRQHTYKHRLQEILSRAKVANELGSTKDVLFISNVINNEEALMAVANFKRQNTPSCLLLLIADSSVQAPTDSEIYLARDNEEAAEIVRGLAFDFVGFLDPNSWYGPEYVNDLLDVFEWAKVARVGHGAYFRAEAGSTVIERSTDSWKVVDEVPYFRMIEQITPLEFLSKRSLDPKFTSTALAVSTLEYLEGTADASDAQLEFVTDLNLYKGKSLNEIESFGENLEVLSSEHVAQGRTAIPVSELLGDSGSTSNVRFSGLGDGSVRIESSLSEGAHEYVYNPVLMDPFMLPEVQGGEVFVGSTPGLDSMLTFIYFDVQDVRVGHSTLFSGRNN
ncbi:CgeB family protein, partial [Corynebacterium lubricantis]|uniref:CgeB family protein n=1 Tax=Corynebacterium lubricantis TaxID=541095 RepID=UPI000378B67B